MSTLCILGIILLITRTRPQGLARIRRPVTSEKLFTQVIEAAKPHILKLWERGDRFFPKEPLRCDTEIQHEPNIGRSYYQCNPHFWQCYWQGGVINNPSLEIDLFGQTFHVVAKASFDNNQHYEFFKRQEPGFDLQYGYIVEMEVKEIPGKVQPMLLADSCRDTFLPQRIYGHGQVKDKKENGFIWDNFGRNLFIDRFYVTNRQANEWYLFNGEKTKVVSDPKKWPHPAFISRKDQKAYCAFLGKRLLEATLFDAATMSPTDLEDTMPDRVLRPDTPWQRDISKSFLGMSRINPDYQLTPLDCQLAQVEGCAEKFFSTDSATWMGFNFGLGFYPESLKNFVEPNKNLKSSSRFLSAASPLHQLGLYADWKGKQTSSMPVAFRCYEEVLP